MIVYLDSSALAKRYIAETGSVEIEALIKKAEVVGTGLITRAEVPAALAKAVRMNWLEQTQAEKMLRVFRANWQVLAVVQTTESLMSLADTLAWEHGLRGYDAVHLASAIVWQEALGEPVTLATFDHNLWQATVKIEMMVWPEVLQ
jgi:uncharacterized protein